MDIGNPYLKNYMRKLKYFQLDYLLSQCSQGSWLYSQLIYSLKMSSLISLHLSLESHFQCISIFRTLSLHKSAEKTRYSSFFDNIWTEEHISCEKAAVNQDKRKKGRPGGYTRLLPTPLNLAPHCPISSHTMALLHIQHELALWCSNTLILRTLLARDCHSITAEGYPEIEMVYFLILSDLQIFSNERKLSYYIPTIPYFLQGTGIILLFMHFNLVNEPKVKFHTWVLSLQMNRIKHFSWY